MGSLSGPPKPEIEQPQRILLVEDDEKVRAMLIRLLQLDGHVVCQASNGEQAIGMADKEKFDAIFLDVKMPKMDGLTTYEKLTAKGPVKNVVFMTAFSRDESIAALLENEGVEYLQKPFTLDAMRQMLKRLKAKQSGPTPRYK